MHRIDTPTAQKDKFGAGKNGFTRGNPQTGTPATDLDNDYFDMLQEELAGVVEASGVNLEKSKHNQLLTALKALLLSRAHPFADIKADGAAAIAEALSNLGLKTAAQRDVGTGSNQVPDMTYWTGGGDITSGWRKTPDGYIEQWGLTERTTTDVFINFPIPFPSGVISINEHDISPSGETRAMWQFQGLTNSNVLAQNIGALTRGITTFDAPVGAGCRWFAKGK